MVSRKKYAKLPGKLVFVGFGSVGQGVMPLLLRHLRITTADIMNITADERGIAEGPRYGIKFIVTPLARGNSRAVLEQILKPGDFLLNVSVDVSSVALIELCQERGALRSEEHTSELQTRFG